MLENFTWYQQSGFRFKGERLVLYIDPWNLKGDLPPADLVLITHAHGDHYSSDDLKRIKGPKTQFVARDDSAGASREEPQDAELLARHLYGNTRFARLVPAEIDHNVVDGAPAARFGAELRQLIETGGAQ